jgi:GH24 family phage-related lysozyme (muramidase)
MRADDELDQACDVLTKHEGLIAWLYCDSKGFVTVGVGDKVSASSTVTMPFVHLLDGSAADAEAKQNAHARVLGHFAKGLTAGDYRACSDLRLPADFCRRRLKYRVTSEFVPAIKKQCPQFAGFPTPAKLVLVDIAYNVGTGGFAAFVQLIADCNAGHFANAAEQVHTQKDFEDPHNPATWGTRNMWRHDTMRAAALAVTWEQHG